MTRRRRLQVLTRPDTALVGHVTTWRFEHTIETRSGRHAGFRRPRGGDFEAIASAFSSYAQALSKAGFKPGQTPTAAQIAALTNAAKSFNTPKLQAAEQHLAAWGQKNWGIGSTTTGG